LQNAPAKFVPAEDLSEFRREDVINEIARCDAEGLVEVRLLRDGRDLVDAVALRLKLRGVAWLREQGTF